MVMQTAGIDQLLLGKAREITTMAATPIAEAIALSVFVGRAMSQILQTTIKIRRDTAPAKDA
jgi:hypothetical protein